MRAWWIVVVAACGGGSSSDCPAFTSLVDGTFSRTPTTLTWTIEVEELPAELTFDREGVPDFVEEYAWAAEVDSDGDGTDDWEVSATHFKTADPEQVAAPLSVLQVDLWQIQGAAASIAGSADATIAGNTFTFTVDAGEDPDLANITAPGQSSYRTFHQFGPALSDQCSDEL